MKSKIQKNSLKKTGKKIQKEIRDIFAKSLKILTLSVFSWIVLALITLLLLWIFVSKANNTNKSEDPTPPIANRQIRTSNF